MSRIGKISLPIGGKQYKPTISHVTETISDNVTRISGFVKIASPRQAEYYNNTEPKNIAFLERLTKNYSTIPIKASRTFGDDISYAYSACLDSNKVVNEYAEKTLDKICKSPDTEKSQEFRTYGFYGISKLLNNAKDNHGNHHQTNLDLALFLDKNVEMEYEDSTDWYLESILNHCKDENGICSKENVEFCKRLYKSKLFSNETFDYHIKNAVSAPKNGKALYEQAISKVNKSNKDGIYNLMDYTLQLIDVKDKDANKVFKILNDNFDYIIENANKMVRHDDGFTYDNIIEASRGRFPSSSIKPENMQKLIDLCKQGRFDLITLAQYVKDENGIISDKNIKELDKITKFTTEVTQYNEIEHRGLDFLYNELKTFRKKGQIQKEFADGYAEICQKYKLGEIDTYNTLNQLISHTETQGLPFNKRATDILLRFLYLQKPTRYGHDWGIIKKAVEYLKDEDGSFNELKLTKFEKAAKLNSNKKITLPLSEIKDSIEKMMFFENFLSRIPDYGNLYTAEDMMYLLWDLKDSNMLKAEIFDIPIGKQDTTLLMYIADILPTEQNKKAYERVLKIIDGVKDIDFNQRDDFGISFLEKVINSENTRLLDFIKNKNLIYFPELEYAYKGVQNPEFKEKLKKLKLRFPNLEQCVLLKSKEMFSKLEKEMESPFFNEQALKEILNNALETGDKDFCKTIINKYTDVRDKVGKDASHI